VIPDEAVEAAAKMPQWMAKYPCPSCGAGYGQCRSFAASGLMCCKECSHPDYKAAQPDPWTAEELVEMWKGRDMPEYIAKEVAKLRGR
jgi:hypothetical protein